MCSPRVVSILQFYTRLKRGFPANVWILRRGRSAILWGWGGLRTWVHIGDLWTFANAPHCEIFEFLQIEHIGAIMNFRTYLYYNYKVKVLNLSWGQKNYEILESMKNPSYTRKKKYKNPVEHSRTSQARFSYFFSLLVISYHIFIIFQSPCH